MSIGKTIREKKKPLYDPHFCSFWIDVLIETMGVSSKEFPVMKSGFRYPQLAPFRSH